MFEGGWKSCVLRWGGFVLGYGVLYAVVEAFGRLAVPGLHGLDQAISVAVQPDAYLFGVDEFFRALTDHTTFLISVPLVSLALAVAVYQMRSQQAAGVAWRIYGRWVIVWWVLVAVISYLEHLKPEIIAALGLTIPLILGLIAGLHAIVPPLRRVPARKYVSAVLWIESVVFLVLWALGTLSWNEGLPGANYVLLPALLVAFGGMTIAFARMSDEAMQRYVGLFVIVMIATISCGVIGTGVIKDSIGRPRPLAEANAPWNAAMRAIPEETLRGASSYPSGHVSGTVSLLTPLIWWVRSRRAKAGLATWCVLQGVSRIYTAAHFFSDCVMGGLFGFGVGTLAFFLMGGPALRKPVESA